MNCDFYVIQVMTVMEEFTDLYNHGSLEAIDRIMEFYSESAEYSLDPVGVFIGKPAIKAAYVQFLEDRKKYGLGNSNLSFTNVKVQVCRLLQYNFSIGILAATKCPCRIRAKIHRLLLRPPDSFSSQNGHF